MNSPVQQSLLRFSSRRQRDTALDAYFDQLLADYARLNEQELPPKVASTLKAATEKRQALGLGWSDAFAVERTILLYLPLETVASRAWYIRDRYQQVVSKAQYAAYDKSRARDATGSALVAEMDALLLAVTEYYILRASCDAERLEFSRSVQLLTFSLLAVMMSLSPAASAIWTTIAPWWVWLIVGGLVSLAGWWTGRRVWVNAGIAIAVLYFAATAVAQQPESETPLVTTLVMDVMAGLFGGAFSLLQRVQAPLTGGDGLTNLLSLRSARRELFLAPITGAVAAIVLYCIFAAKLVTGALFPDIVGPKANSDGTTSMSIMSFISHSGPAGAVDHAKSLVWSFIAGFSERLVPDSISRLTSKAAQSKTTA